MRLSDLVETSNRVAAASGRLAKIALLADLLKQAAPDEVQLVIAYLSGTIRQSRIGVGWATLEKAKQHVGTSPQLLVRDVDAVLEKLAAVSGKGSAAEKQRLLGELFSQATALEQDFLFRLLTGELRQGALEGIMVEAVAKARELPVSEVRRAVMLAGDLASVARGDLKDFAIQLFRPIKPMLAKTGTLEDVGPAAFEYKLDGIRIQVHKRAQEVRIYSRTLNDITAQLPSVADISTKLDGSEMILDGEAVVLDPTSRPVRFQDTMKGLATGVPFFFDILYLDGTPLVDQPYSTRVRVLAEHVPESRRPPRIVTADTQEAQRFFEAALAAGQEGLMAKGLDSRYEAGRRGNAWTKIKRANTLDLVVLAAEWGHGRRHGRLSNLHLGARDPAGGFVMLGKTFKGMTDELLAWQTSKLQELAVRREGHIVYVKPELVVEIAFNGLQASPHYPGGLALRFARVLRYREDKHPEEADTIQTVRRLYEG